MFNGEQSNDRHSSISTNRKYQVISNIFLFSNLLQFVHIKLNFPGALETHNADEDNCFLSVLNMTLSKRLGAT